MKDQINSFDKNTKIAVKAELIAASGAFVLAVIKLILFFFTGSMVIALSAWDSSSDVVVSLINHKIIKFARLKADDNHPYGHGRAESLAALGQGSLIIGGAIGIIVSSVQQIFNYSKNKNSSELVINYGLVIFFVFAAFVSIAITKWLLIKGKELRSTALIADAEHYKVDFITNICSAIGILAVCFFKNQILDPIVALIFSIYIIYGAFSLIRNSIHELMDHDISQEIKDRVQEIILSHDKEILDVHRLRGRKSGHNFFFDLHITLPDHFSFIKVHEIIENIENKIKYEFDGDVVIHTDPESIRLAGKD